jgi:hypothetical protein
MLGTESCYTRLLRSSYIHPNGFYKIPLFEFDHFGPKIRLHVWIPNRLTPSDIDTNLHTHHWNFESVVIAGQLRHVTFLEMSGNSHVKHKLTRRPADGHALQAVSTCSLCKSCEQHFAYGDSYSLRAVEIHQLSPSAHDRVTATLIHQHRHTEQQNYVYLPASDNLQSGENTPRRLTESDISILLTELCRAQEQGMWSQA